MYLVEKYQFSGGPKTTPPSLGFYWRHAWIWICIFPETATCSNLNLFLSSWDIQIQNQIQTKFIPGRSWILYVVECKQKWIINRFYLDVRRIKTVCVVLLTDEPEFPLFIFSSVSWCRYGYITQRSMLLSHDSERVFLCFWFDGFWRCSDFLLKARR